jgi:hypothetical protein
MIKFFGLFILLGLFSASCGKNSEASARFGEKVKYSQNTPVKFEDFTLVFTGERRVSADKFPNGFLYYDFDVKPPAKKKAFVDERYGRYCADRI